MLIIDDGSVMGEFFLGVDGGKVQFRRMVGDRAQADISFLVGVAVGFGMMWMNSPLVSSRVVMPYFSLSRIDLPITKLVLAMPCSVILSSQLLPGTSYPSFSGSSIQLEAQIGGEEKRLYMPAHHCPDMDMPLWRSLAHFKDLHVSFSLL